jgi:hypothetical protein
MDFGSNLLGLLAFVEMLCGSWNVRSLYRAGSLTAAARKLTRYKLDLMGVQEVAWN